MKISIYFLASFFILINFSLAVDITIKKLVYTLCSIIEYEGSVIWDHTKPDGMPRKLLDVSKLSNFGWKAKTKFEDGLTQTYEWYKKRINYV